MLQDYHRFHVPVSGVIENFVDVSGSLYTVSSYASCLSSFSPNNFPSLFFYEILFNLLINLPPQVNPIAVNSKYCNVFTENKRTVAIISTEEFGKVCHPVFSQALYLGMWLRDRITRKY